jgi:hypothetical protein
VFVQRCLDADELKLASAETYIEKRWLLQQVEAYVVM